jgi:hypothetical protein
LAISAHLCVSPLELIGPGLAPEIRRVSQRHLLIQRVFREDDLHLAGIQIRYHPDDLHVDRFARRRERVTSSEKESNPSRTLARGGQSIVHDRAFRIANLYHRARCQGLIKGCLPAVATGVNRIRTEGLDRGRQTCDRVSPSRRVRVGGSHESLQHPAVLLRENVKIQIRLTDRLLYQLTKQDERTGIAPERIEIEPALEVRRQSLKVSLSCVSHRGDRYREFQEAGGRTERQGLFPKRVVEHDTRLLARGKGLLVKHLGAGLTIDRRQARFRQREGFGHP